MMLNNIQRKSQITNSHRLIELTRKIRHKLDTSDGYGKNAICIPQSYFYNEIIDRLVYKFNNSIEKRQSALLKRMNLKSSKSSYNKLQSIEYATEALFDNYFFKSNERYVNKKDTTNLLKSCIEKYNKIILIMPILSRKPLSPIKNKGYLPDIGEINTLLRCAKLARLINNVSGIKCKFLILSDGNKYSRACKTPSEIISLYQNTLKYWIDYLNISDCIKLVDYESWVTADKENNWIEQRNSIYLSKYKYITENYDKIFSVDYLFESCKNSNDDLIKQLIYTYMSIVTSVNYSSLYSIYSPKKQLYTRENQNFYLSFIASLQYSTNKASKSHLFSNDLIGNMSTTISDNINSMRIEAWEAAKRYVAISLTDRELNTIFNKIFSALKLTIHAKVDEYNFISTNKKHYSMTAQHTVAGVNIINEEIVIDYQYRLSRDENKQIGIYIEPLLYEKENFDPLNEIAAIKQPIFYINEKDIL